MVGEIRDGETAEIAIHAALTGHLVFSTLHTNDSASAVARLLDMGAEPFLVASSVEGVLAQRLVRRLCPHCKRPYLPGDSEMIELRTIGGYEPGMELFHPTGCDNCRGTGYMGRVGLYELLAVDETIEALILEQAPSSAIREAGQRRGLVTLREEGWKRVLEGVTSVEEITRVTHEDESVVGVGDDARHAD
jgi:general secretion pathway protein E